MSSTSDVLIIGGGVIGLTTAYRLAERGASVIVADRRQVGQEASWAGAGMLPPGHQPHHSDPEVRLRSYSHQMWPQLSAELKEKTGIDNGYLNCGSTEVFEDDEALQHQLEAWFDEGITAQELNRSELERHVPELNTHFQRGVFLPDFGQARNPRHLKALSAACQQRGVEIIENISDVILSADPQNRVSVKTEDRHFSAGQICICAGSWTGRLLQTMDVSLPLHPVRGQIAQLKVPRLPFTCVIEQGRRYLVPRADGLILVGSTEEHVGYEKQTTAEGIAGLLTFCRSLVPDLGDAELVRSWAGLRPGSPDQLPFLGRLPEFENLYVGAGHFRSGLQMSPGTGSVLADLLLGQEPQISLDGLTVDRLTASNP